MMMERSTQLVVRVGAVLVGLLAAASAQTSCVQVPSASFSQACPCDAGSEFTFSMQAEPTTTGGTPSNPSKVNLAIVIDSSTSVTDEEFSQQKEFAKSVMASFDSQGIFEAGGTASFLQFATFASVGGTFTSAADFNAFVDNEPKLNGASNIANGIARARVLLQASPTDVSYMVVFTDGDGVDPAAEADAARAEGTVVFAVALGAAPIEATLLDVAGDPANIFDLDDFASMGAALEGIIPEGTGGGTSVTSGEEIPCTATNPTITVTFNAQVISAVVPTGPVAFSGNQAVFVVPSLDAASTDFTAVLDTCTEDDEIAPGSSSIVANVIYGDDQGNTPDMSLLTAAGVVPLCETVDVPTPAPSVLLPVVPTPSPIILVLEATSAPVSDTPPAPAPVVPATTPAPMDATPPTPAPMDATPPTPAPMDVAAPTPAPMDATPPTPAPMDATPPTPAPVDATSPTPAPSAPSIVPESTCVDGTEGVDGNGVVCCSIGCTQCGGFGCTQAGADAGLGAADCCGGAIKESGLYCDDTKKAPCIIGSAAEITICSDGVTEGVDGNGVVCCPIGCTQCGGEGCSSAGISAGLDSRSCCGGAIKASNLYCGDGNAAPCIIGSAP